MRNILITSLLSFSLLLGSSSKASTEHQIDATLLQRIRQLLGIVQPIETAGTRGQPQKVCMISPFVSSLDQVAIIPTDKPIIKVLEPLNALSVETEDELTIWKIVGSSTSAIKGSISWPVDPISPGQSLVIVVRPRGASGGDTARIKLKGASKDVMAQTKHLLSSLNGNPKKWEEALIEAFNSKNYALAIILINRSYHLSSTNKIALNELIAKESCRREPLNN